MRYRKDNGAALRDAMSEAGVSIPQLARATADADPTGRGVSQALIGFLVSQGKSARDRCGDRSAQLISTALHRQEDELFVPGDSITPPSSTATQEGSSDVDDHAAVACA